MAYCISQAPTLEEFGVNHPLASDLAHAARALNKRVGKINLDELHEIAFSGVTHAIAREIIHSILGDEIASYGNANVSFLRTGGLVNRLHVQILRLRVTA